MIVKYFLHYHDNYFLPRADPSISLTKGETSIQKKYPLILPRIKLQREELTRGFAPTQGDREI